jgi:sugar phosphate isomerase/epimerase
MILTRAHYRNEPTEFNMSLRKLVHNGPAPAPLRITRRYFLQSSASAATAALALAQPLPSLHAAASAKIKLGVTDWNLRHDAKPSSIAFAKTIGFDGVEISLGRAPNGQKIDRLPVAEPAVLDEYLAETAKSGFPIASTCLDILHQNYLKNDPLGQKWVADAIPLTKRLGARVILLPFFGKGALETRAEMDYVADFLKEIGPTAERTGVILGVEDTISAEDNARILDRAQCKAVQVYYDVGNSQPRGFDIYKEIRWLGKDRICEFHLKDNPRLLGQGLIDFPRVIEAIVEIGFSGWAHLETVAPSGNIRTDMTTNLAYIRGLLAKH